MAFFKKTTKAEKVSTEKAVVVSRPTSASPSTTSVLLRPHITEKAGLLAQSGIYTFEVTRDADEASVIRAVAQVYKVSPLRASLTPIRTKTMFARGRRGETGGGRKAYVYLPKGQTIEFI